MRFLAILPVLLCTAALVLTFLCLFAGDSPGFMEDYAIITLNTSRFGEDFINSTSDSSTATSILQSLIDNITSIIEQDIDDGINDLAKAFGLRDFYSLHVLDYCEGYYEPSAVPNATLSSSQIWQNVTSCSNRTALFTWDPRELIQAELNKSGNSFIDISKLDWPSQIDATIEDLQGEFKATFVLYCIAIGLIFFAFFAAILSFFLLGRLYAFINVGLDALAFIAILIASSLVTAVMKQGSSQINNYGNSVGVEAYYSGKFLGITWAATALMFVASCVWCLDCVIGRRNKTPRHSSDEDIKMAKVKGRR